MHANTGKLHRVTPVKKAGHLYSPRYTDRAMQISMQSNLLNPCPRPDAVWFMAHGAIVDMINLISIDVTTKHASK
jgi:hypothetical protein